MDKREKALTYEEAKELCKNAFVSGILYGTESIRYGTDAVAYNWDHWLKNHEDRFKPPDTWESIIYDVMQAGRTEETVDVTPLIDRCKALADASKEVG